MTIGGGGEGTSTYICTVLYTTTSYSKYSTSRTARWAEYRILVILGSLDRVYVSPNRKGRECGEEEDTME